MNQWFMLKEEFGKCLNEDNAGMVMMLVYDC
jgi:hypothetical protein